MKKLLIIAFLFSTFVQAETTQDKSDLDKKLDELHLPDDKVTPVLSRDELYVVNERYSSLRNRHEVSFLGANNFTSDSHLNTKQVGFAYRYHFTSRWSLGLRYNTYTNKLTDAGVKLYEEERIVAIADYPRNSTEIFLNVNAIYGKIRWSQDSVTYFDQYISLGGGKINLAADQRTHVFADIGLAFWLGGHMSARIGIKNEYYKHYQENQVREVHNAMGYLEFGYLFGKGDRG